MKKYLFLFICSTLLNAYGSEIMLEKTTECSYIAEAGVPQQAQRGGYVRAKSDYIKPEDVQFSMDFKAEGKNWTMYYTDIIKSKRENVVSAIYFVQDDYSPVSSIGNEISSPPRMKNLIYHDIGANEFVGAYVTESKKINGRMKTVTREIKLPDDVANELMGLLLGDTKFKPLKFLQNSLKVVHTPDMESTVIK